MSAARSSGEPREAGRFTPARDVSAYRLRPVGLEDKALAQIRVFLGFSPELATKWTLVQEGREDARIEPQRAGVGLGLRLAQRSGVEIVLAWPLQFEDFSRALGRLEAALQASAAAVAVEPAAAAPVPVPAGATFLLPSELRQRRFRLKRWPPSAVLVQHKYHPRLASFLSMQRPVSLTQLSVLSNVALDQCERFLALLWPLGIVQQEGEPLSLRGSAAVLPSPAGGARPAPQTVKVDALQAQRLGVVQRLRQRLGIGASE